MVTPALLMLASGSLIATVLVRLGRIIDRIRHFAEVGTTSDELTRYERRATLAERAVVMLFLAVTAVVLDGASIALDHALGGTIAALPIGLTLVGMALIVGGAAAMARETQLALEQMRAEVSALHTRVKERSR
jgi:hypothetical protein